MARIMILITALALCLVPAFSCAELAGTVFDDYEPLYTLAETYGFKMGGAFSYGDLDNEAYMDFLDRHFNSLTCTNETKAYSLLNQYASQHSEDGMPRMKYTQADRMIAWAQEHGKGVRGHVLVWDAYMTEWFFHEDYDERKPYADQETMRERLKSYIEQVITHFEEKYPSVIYCWDVVNEAIGDNSNEWREGDVRHLRTKRNKKNNVFLDHVGNDYVAYAFLCARDTVEKLGVDIRLFYNDYNMFQSEKRIAAMALMKSINVYAKDENGEYRTLVDGIGMQGYLGGYGKQEGCMDNKLLSQVRDSLEMYHSRGYEVQITEMAVRNYDPEKAAKHAEFYSRLFEEVFIPANQEDINTLTAVCIWGLVDSPLSKSSYEYKMNSPYGGFLTRDYKIKTCFDTVYHTLKGN